MYEKEKKIWISKVEKFLSNAEECGLKGCFPDLEHMKDETKKDLGE